MNTLNDIFAREITPERTKLDEKEFRQQYGVVEDILTKLRKYYTHSDIEELVINRPRELWLRRRRPKPDEKIWVPVADEDLTFEYLEKVTRVIANANDMEFGPGNDENPAVYATLPGGHRFTAAMYTRIVYDEVTPRGGVAIAIRQAPREENNITYADYGLQAGVRVERTVRFKERDEKTHDDLDKLLKAISGGSNLLISGATGTGKTTLLNHIIKELHSDSRIITLEDTRELNIPHANRFHIVLSRTNMNTKFDDAAAINLMTRMTPDIIICGEISTNNAGTIWELTGSGHGSMMTTIHAESPELALETFTDRMRHSQENLNAELIQKKMRERFTVVQIERNHLGRRRITAIETFK